MSLTVKVFYEKDNGNKEIRRFPINVSDDDIYKTTTDKIRKLYPDLSHGNFQLHWQDSDGDQIVFSCTEEMQEAVRHVQDGVLRIYITGVSPKVTPEPQSAPKTPSGEQKQQDQQGQQRQDKSSGPSENQGNFHPGVTCDGCEGAIYGIRYKCCVCPDYDLCSKCEGLGLHQEHDMFKIITPRVNPTSFMPPHMGRHFHRYMQGFMNGTQAGASASAQASSSTSSQAGGDNASSGGDKCKDKAKFDDYLKNVGANIAAFLDPFGIDVTYDVHHGDGTPETGGFRAGRGCGWRRGRGRGCGAWRNMQQKAETENTSGTTEPQAEKAEEKMETDQTKKTTAEETAPAPNAQANQDVPMDDKTPVIQVCPYDNAHVVPEKSFTKHVEKCKLQNAEKQQHEKSPTPTDDWTIVPEDGTDVLIPSPAPIPLPFTAPTTSAAATAPQVPTEGPQVTSASAPVSTDNSGRLYPNLRIQQSLDQMLAMGFTNNNGWLADLLTEHNGDIGTTLDAIKAKAQQQLENIRESR